MELTGAAEAPPLGRTAAGKRRGADRLTGPASKHQRVALGDVTNQVPAAGPGAGKNALKADSSAKDDKPADDASRSLKRRQAPSDPAALATSSSSSTDRPATRSLRRRSADLGDNATDSPAMAAQATGAGGDQAGRTSAQAEPTDPVSTRSEAGPSHDGSRARGHSEQTAEGFLDAAANPTVASSSTSSPSVSSSSRKKRAQTKTIDPRNSADHTERPEDEDVNATENKGGKPPKCKTDDENEPWYGEGVRYKAGEHCPRGHNTVVLPKGVEDVEERHPNDPLYCPTYVKDVYSYLRSLQFKHRVEPDYMTTVQAAITATYRITPKMRHVLVDWLVEVAEEFMLLSDTLYLCVSYIDRVLSRRRVLKPQLQLVGAVCLFLAAKYEEEFAPTIKEFVLVCVNSYSRTELLNMETMVLKDLDFCLTTATPKVFLRRFQRAAFTRSIEKHLGNYLSELALLCYELVSCPADRVAAAAVFLARATLYASDTEPANIERVKEEEDIDGVEEIWTPSLVHYSSYTGENLAQIIRKLHELHVASWKGTAVRAVFNKYSLQVFEKVSTSIQPYPARGACLPLMGKDTFYLF